MSRRERGSLNQQILKVEQRLIQGRTTLRMRAATARQQLRNMFSSPTALLLAAGIGFAAGYFNSAQKAKRAAGKAAKSARAAAILATVAATLTQAGWVMGMLPALKTVPKPNSGDSDDSESDFS